MSMTVVVIRKVSDRIRGFLASSMLEMTPGVYSAPRIVGERLWRVLSEWDEAEDEASIVMLWQDSQVSAG